MDVAHELDIYFLLRTKVESIFKIKWTAETVGLELRALREAEWEIDAEVLLQLLYPDVVQEVGKLVQRPRRGVEAVRPPAVQVETEVSNFGQCGLTQNISYKSLSINCYW